MVCAERSMIVNSAISKAGMQIIREVLIPTCGAIVMPAIKGLQEIPRKSHLPFTVNPTVDRLK
jgi:hypothetical protein